jgi:hypothetical protein
MNVTNFSELPIKEEALKSLIGENKKIELDGCKKKIFYNFAVKNTSWKPNPYELAHVIDLILKVKDGGCWICPDGRSVWTFFKQKKMVRVSGPDIQENRKIRKILLLLGFSVLVVGTNQKEEKK